MKRRIPHLIGGIIALLALTFLVNKFVSDWDTLRPLLESAKWGEVALATLLFAFAMLGLALTWGELIGALGGSARHKLVAAWYFLGESGKYLPGGVWPLLGRGELARRGGVERSVSYVSVLGSLGFMCLSASLVALGLAPWGLSFGGATAQIAVLALAPVGLLVVHPKVMGQVDKILRGATKGKLSVPVLPWIASIRLALLGCPTWILIGFAHVIVAKSLGLDVNTSRVMFASIVAWIGGLLALGAPAGIGVREAIFVSLAGISGGSAVAVTAIARLACVLVDALGALFGVAILGTRAMTRRDEVSP